MVRFSYVPQSQLRINADSTSSGSRKESFPDFSCASSSRTDQSYAHEDEHVLVLEFVDNSRAKKGPSSGYEHGFPYTAIGYNVAEQPFGDTIFKPFCSQETY